MSKPRRRFVLSGDIGDGYFVLKPISLNVYYDVKQCVWCVEDFVPELLIGCQAKRLNDAVARYVYLLKQWYRIVGSTSKHQRFDWGYDVLVEGVRLFIELNDIITHEEAGVYFWCMQSFLKKEDHDIMEAFWAAHKYAYGGILGSA